MNICKSLGLDEENTLLAYIIALFHDIGRFEQARVYNTFNDSKSVDHAELGCHILFDEGLIKEIIDTRKYDSIIKKAIYYHNKFSIDIDDSVVQCKIIRDADKIDIIHIVADLGEINLNEDDNGISDFVKEDFKNERLVNRLHKSTKNDATLTMVAFVFDLNFDYSFNYFNDNKFIDKIYSKLKNKELFSPYIDIANNYVKKRCNNGN